MSIKTFNKFIATEPPKAQNARVAKVIAGMALINEKLSLLPLTVVFDSEQFKAGDIVFVDSNNSSNHIWSKNVYEYEGRTFILVPDNFILMASTSA